MNGGAVSPPRSANLLALGGLALVVLGPTIYSTFLHVPWVRSSALPAWILIALGLVLGIRAVRASARWWPRIAFALSFFLGATFATGVLFLTDLPDAGAAARAGRAADFSLPNQHGRVTVLADELAKGPVMLVFFRGSW